MDDVKEMLRDYKDWPINKNVSMRAIDDATQERAVLIFLKDLKTITDSGASGELLTNEVTWMLELGKENFARLAIQFQNEDFCPNECGLMLQSLLLCDTCTKKLQLCKKKDFCGERKITIHEMEDLILDCELNWHKLSKGLTNYRFFRVTHVYTENFLSEGKNPILTKPMATKSDAGYYVCDLGLKGYGQATFMGFRVTVLPRRVTPEVPVDIDLPKDGFPDGVGNPQQPNTTTAATTTTTQIPPTPSSKNMLKGRLVGLLICATVVLIAGIATAILYFHSGKFIDFIKTCQFGGGSEEDDEPELSKKESEDLGEK
ncbi:izumo sperm-egg fusion protein 1 isoform X2 [Talpa occidentalis]|nr:izumo sperm-egg fusion protein 1 isoform X2 [Talpa occidentalis]XP_037372825.1 izumo sperm-egg fusion protein 1 isoform X2 [Talpa occidentalis]